MLLGAGSLVAIRSQSRALSSQIRALIRRNMNKPLLSSFSLDLPYHGTIKRQPCLAQGKALNKYQICPHGDLKTPRLPQQ